MLLGLVTVRAWGYWWGYTAAQIELLAADAPTVVYGNRKKAGKPSRADIEEAKKRWDARYGGRTRKVSLSEILNRR